MSAKLGAVRYGTEHGDPFLGRTMGTQADYSHEVAHDIDDEVRKLIEAAHTEAWEILTEYRDVLDVLAGELLEKETLHRAELRGDLRRREEASAADHVRRLRRPRAVGQAADQDAGRAGHRARRAVAQADAGAGVQDGDRPGAAGRRRRPSSPTAATATARNGAGRAASAARRPTQPDYGAPAGWHAPGWPPRRRSAAAAAAATGIRRHRRQGGSAAARSRSAAVPAVSRTRPPTPPGADRACATTRTPATTAGRRRPADRRLNANGASMTRQRRPRSRSTPRSSTRPAPRPRSANC